MPDVMTQHNISALGTLQRLTDNATATAASTGDATTVTGNTIDRMGFSTGSMPRSAAMGVSYEATLTSGKTLSIAYAVQDSADGTTFADYQTGSTTLIATGPSGGGVKKGVYNIPVDLNSARRYVRFNFQPDLSATQTDTFYGEGIGFMAGFSRLPAPGQTTT